MSSTTRSTTAARATSTSARWASSRRRSTSVESESPIQGSCPSEGAQAGRYARPARTIELLSPTGHILIDWMRSPVHSPRAASPHRLSCVGFLVLVGLFLLDPVRAQEPVWTEAETRTTLERTLTIRLAPDLSQLTPAEQTVVAKLLEAG